MRAMRVSIKFVALAVNLWQPHVVLAQEALDPLALGRTGWAAIEGKRFGDALAMFTQAARTRPDDASMAMGAGAAAFMLGRNAEAATWLETALQLNPRYVEASVLLGEIHYRAGRVLEAIATYEVAAGQAPQRQALGERLRAWKQEAQLLSGFRQSRSSHFSVFYQGVDDGQTAVAVMDMLEAAYTRLGTVLAAYPAEPITVVLYTQEQFEDVTRLPAWAAGSYDGRIRLPAPDVHGSRAELEAVLGHELTHAVVSSLGGRAVPVWLNEGLAGALEPNGIEDAAAALARTHQRIALSSLHESFSTLPGALVPLAYAQSTDAVARLMAMGGTTGVVGLLRDLADGVDFERAFERRFRVRYDDFEQAVTR
jgi:tetratricopeptide (TPR) repeat protein